MEVETSKIADQETAQEILIQEKIKSAKKCIKLFKSGEVEKAYKKELEKAEQIKEEKIRDGLISYIEEEQTKNVFRYMKAVEFLKSFEKKN